MKRSVRISLLLSLLLLVMLSLVLTACGGDDSDGQVKPEICEHEWEEERRDTDFYCGEEGFVYYSCMKCPATKTESLGLGDHPEHALETREGYEPTCYSDGLTDGVFCNRCMTYTVEQTVIPGGHTMEAIVAKAPTCTEDGVTAGSVCTKCDYADPRPEILYALNHDIRYTGGVDVTCTTDGMTPAEDCLREGCGYHKDPEVIEHPGHNLEYYYGYEATCTSAGMTDEVWCTNWYLDCDYRIEAEEIPSLGHDIKSHTTTAATCCEGGVIGGKYCDRCKIEMTPSFVTLRTDCAFDADGVCAACGTRVTAGLTYADYRDGVAVTGVADFTGTKLVIPSSYNGKKVLAVAAEAFRGNTSIVEVVLPSTVETVGAHAFSGCTALLKVTVFDFDAVEGFDGAWCDDDDVKIYATYNHAKNPFETYLAALDRMQTNADRYRLTIHQTASEAIPMYENYVSTDTATIVREKAGNNWYEYVDLQTVDSQGGMSMAQIQRLKTWYYNGKLYQDVFGEVKQNNQTLQSQSQKAMMTAGLEYMRSLVLDAGESLPRLDETYFEDVDYYLSAGGTYTLRLVMDGEKMLEYVLSVMGDSITDLIENGAEIDITTCTYVFTLDGEGHLLTINADCEMTLGAAGTVVMTGEGHSSYVWTEIGTLAAVTAPGTGYTDYTHTNCGHHSTAKNPGKAPTCTEDGTTDGIYCLYCYADIQAMTTAPATGHTDADNDGKCDTCDGWVDASNGLLYEFSEDGKTVTVLGIGTCTDTRIVIPAELYGMKVTAIAAGAFRGTGITEIVIPPTVTEIGANALPDTLTRATLPTAVLSALPKSVELVFINGGETIKTGSLVDLKNLWGLYIGETVRSVEEDAASGCTNLYVVIYNYNSGIYYATPGTDAYGGLVKYATIMNSGNESALDERFERNGDFLWSDSYTSGKSTLIAYFGNDRIVTLPASYKDKPTCLHKEVFRNNATLEKLVFLASHYNFLPYYDEIAVNCPNLVTLEGHVSTIESIRPYNSDTGLFAQIKHIIVTGGESVSTFWSNKGRALEKITFGASVGRLGDIENSSVIEIEILGKDTAFTTDTFDDLRNLQKVTFPEGLTALPESIFFNRSSLKEVILPSTLTEIPYRAFRGCSSLERIVIPEGVTRIDTYAFYGCTSLSQVSLPSTLRWLGNYAFYSNTALTSITLPTMPAGEELTLGTNLFEKSGLRSIAIPEGVAKIGSYCFSQCAALEAVTLPTTLRTVQSYAFDGVTLDELVLPEGVTMIQEAFTGLVVGKINLPASATNMSYAFGKVGTLVIADGVTSISSTIFDSNGSLRTLVIGKGLTSFSDSKMKNAYEIIAPNGISEELAALLGDNLSKVHAGPDSRLLELEGCLFYRNADGTYLLVEYLSAVPENLVLPTLPDGATYAIAAKAFNNRSYKTLVIPSCVTAIGKYAFASNRDLVAIYFNATLADGTEPSYIFAASGNADTVLTIGKDVTRIAAFTFAGESYRDYLTCGRVVFEEGSVCTEIAKNAFSNIRVRSFTFPSHVTTVGSYIFSSFNALEELVWAITEPTNVSDDALAGAMREYSQSQPNVKVVIASNVKALPEYFFADRGFGYRVTEIVFEGTCQLTSLPRFHDSNAANYQGTQYYRLESLVLPASITAIPDYAFHYCKSLTSVTLPEGLLTIGESAFPSSLTSVNLPSSLKSIGKNAFAGTQLTSAVLPAGLGMIGEGAFKNCTLLSSVTFPTGSFVLSTWAFRGCTSLTEVTVPDGATEIGLGVFQECTQLETLSLPYVRICAKTESHIYGTVDTPLLYRLFYYDTSTVYSLPDTIQNLKHITVRGGTIGEQAFQKMQFIETITLTGTVSEIGKSAFSNCSKLTKLVIDAPIEAIGESTVSVSTLELHINDLAAWCGISFVSTGDNLLLKASALYVDGVAVTELAIPEGVTEIKPYVFANAKMLTKVTLPSTVKTIGKDAFYNCSAITAVVLNEGLTEIGENAFQSCSNLVDVTLPSTLTTMGKRAFAYCKSLTSINLQDTKLTVIPEGAFNWANLSGELLLPAGIVAIEADAFYFESSYYSGGITKVTLPLTLTSVGDEAFRGQNKLATLIIEEGEGAQNLTIGAGAFQNAKLTKLIIPIRVTWIGNYAFQADKTPLKTIYLRASSDSGFATYWDLSSMSGLQRYYYTVEKNYTGD